MYRWVHICGRSAAAQPRVDRAIATGIGLTPLLSEVTLLAHDCSSVSDCLETAGFNAVMAATGGALALAIIASLRDILAAIGVRDGGTLDRTAYQDQRELYGDMLAEAFPHLGDEYEVLGPATQDYNCIGHTLGADEWVNPQTGPPGSELSEMDALYAEKGYVRLSGLDYSHQAGHQKIVVYATLNADGTIREVTHGAIQYGSEGWSSKLGGAPLILHQTPEALNGQDYGQPVAVYKR